MAKSSVSLKLLIDTEAKRLLFAEASNDCVEFLFHILSLPLAKVISLLGKQEMVGTVANLYESLENLNDSYINQNQTRDTILKPLYPASAGISNPLLATTNDNENEENKNNDPPQKTYYRCANCSSSRGRMYFSDEPNVACPYCLRKMGWNNCHYVAPPVQVPSTDGTGLVNGVVSYMVLDDLVVRPMSSVSCITLLNELNVKDVGALQEKVVHLGMTEAVKLLKASLETKNVLTHVFLKDLGCPTAVSQEHEEKQPVVGKRKRQSVASRPTKEDGPSMSNSSIEEVPAGSRARRTSVSRPPRKGVKKH